MDDDLQLNSFSTFKKYASVKEAVEAEGKSRAPLTKNVWRLEQAIVDPDGQPSHDFKVFMFYGQVGVIQEVRRNPFSETPNEFYYHHPAGGEMRVNGARKN